MLGRTAHDGPAHGDPTKVGTPRRLCIVCGYVYDPERGDPERGIPPGTPWEALPSDWRCPMCRVPKADFDPFPG